MHGFGHGHGLGALALLPDLLRGLRWNLDRMRAAIEPGMFATDRAIELARAGTPFREAYRAAASDSCPQAGLDSEASLAARTSPGGAADLRLDVLQARLDALAT